MDAGSATAAAGTGGDGMPRTTPPGGARLDVTDVAEVAEVAALAADCRLCRLFHTRLSVVFGEGDPSADVMFVTEGPGYHDDRAGRPLAGRGGEVLDEMLASIGLDRDRVYVTSVVKCRPPRNRTPFPDEIEACEGYLFRQVTLVRPRVVCALGNVALRLLAGRPQSIGAVHGRPLDVTIGGRVVTVLPLYHPAAAAVSDDLLDTLRREFRSIPALVRGRRGEADAGEPGGTGNPVSAADAPACTDGPGGAGQPDDSAVQPPATGDDDPSQLTLNIG